MAVTTPKSAPSGTRSVRIALRLFMTSARRSPWRRCLPDRSSPARFAFKVEATGLCHTDIHAAHGDWPVKP